jgi:diguanylate cyclase
MSEPGPTQSKRNEHLRFVARIYRMRSLGLGFGCLAVAGALYEDGAAWYWWLVLIFNGCLWPTLAYWLACRSRDPRRSELRNLVVDSMAGGMWVAVMQFNLLPSALLVVMLSADKVGVGGWKFLLRTASAQLVTCAATWALLGFPFDPRTSMFDILLCLPFMASYPMALSTVAYALGRKVVRQNRALDHLSRVDGLTELFNRRHWEETATTEFARGERTGRYSALLMLDIDHFKQINDVYGHPIGDKVLKGVAAILHSSVRDTDTAARYGGDEFGIVLAEASLDDAKEVAERIRMAAGTLRIAEAPGLRCAVSIGIAAGDSTLSSVSEWVRRADQALYRAKQEGRNRIAHDDMVATPAELKDESILVPHP